MNGFANTCLPQPYKSVRESLLHGLHEVRDELFGSGERLGEDDALRGGYFTLDTMSLGHGRLRHVLLVLVLDAIIVLGLASVP